MLLLPVCGSVLGLETSSIGFAKSASAFADMLLFYPAGQVMDRHGRKWTAVPSLITLSVGVLLIGWASGYPSLLLGGIVAGVGNGLGAGINMTLAGDFAPPDARADFIGVWRLMTDAGAALSPFAMGAVAHAMAVGAASLVPFGLGLLGAFVLATRVPEPLPRGSA
jgi:MFS family permease